MTCFSFFNWQNFVCPIPYIQDLAFRLF